MPFAFIFLLSWSCILLLPILDITETLQTTIVTTPTITNGKSFEIKVWLLEWYFCILEPQDAFPPASVGLTVGLGVPLFVMSVLFVVALLWGKKRGNNAVVGKGKYNR